MQDSRMMLKEGTEEVRGGYMMQAHVEDVPKGPGTKGKPVDGIRRMDLGREDNPKDRRKRVCDGDPASKVKDHRSTSAKIGRAPNVA
jgi:hypothetical protein